MDKLYILIPQYKEPFEVIKPLLDSIGIQQNVDFDRVHVIICKDGEPDNNSYRMDPEHENIIFSERGHDRYEYPYKIHYYICEHGGVSATRNACLDKAIEDSKINKGNHYVMFCDIDDMFFNNYGLYIIFREIDAERPDGQFDTMMSAFIEETRMPKFDKKTKKPIIDPRTGRPETDKDTPIYIPHPTDSTFVHGKVHRLKFLINNNIRWNNSLTIHEDSFFNCLCQRLAGPENTIYCPLCQPIDPRNPNAGLPMAFYLWRWRDESVCRHDPDYILKTYNNMLDSNTALVEEFRDRGRKEDAQFFVTTMIYDAYFTMNKDEWLKQENQDYRKAVEKRFKRYYQEYENIFLAIDEDVKRQIIMGIKNRMFGEGLMMESITFNDWIAKIEELED